MQRSILVVEDESAIAESIEYVLRREGFEVTIAQNLREARARIKGRDLVIMDLMLPDGSGFDLLREIRAAGNLPVIVVTSRDDEPDRVAGLESGADDYVTKPFSPREIVARVRAVLRRTGGRSSGPPTDLLLPRIAAHRDDPGDAAESPQGGKHPKGYDSFGSSDSAAEGRAGARSPEASDIEVRADERRVSYRGVPVELTRAEFDLLATLLSGRGRVFSRQQLIEAIWGHGHVVGDRTIDGHVKAVRRKLTESGAPESLVTTVRGVGYRFEE